METVTITPLDPAITLEQLTLATVEGSGSFDTLMRAFKAHIDVEWDKNRLRGPEYSQVYLGGLQQVMQTALSFTMSQREQTLKNILAEEQITLAKITQRAEEAKILQTQAQTALIEQQRTNLIDDLLTSAKQREKLDAEIDNLILQKDVIAAQIIEMQQRGEMIKQQILNLKDELLTSVVQRQKLSQEVLNLQAQLPLIEAQIREMDNRADMVAQQILKLQAEILTEQSTRERIAQEILLMQAKVQTERAQTIDGLVGPTSILGRQGSLIAAQSKGFESDALQKASQIMTDTWKIRRTTDEATVADGVNALADPVIGKTVLHMLRQAGVPEV